MFADTFKRKPPEIRSVRAIRTFRTRRRPWRCECRELNACAIVIEGRAKALLIHGRGASSALNRKVAADYSFLVVRSSSQVTIADFQIVDVTNVSDYTHPTNVLTASNAAFSPPTSIGLRPAISIENSSFVTLKNVSVQNAKLNALEIRNSKDVSVTGCTFSNAFMLGAQLVDALNTRISFDSNLFIDNRSNPLVLQGSSLTVTHNKFYHNHRASAWWASSTVHLPSSGGMIFIYNHVHSLLFSNNEIYGGQIDEQIDPKISLREFGLQVHGIEIDYAGDLGQTTDLSDINITNNLIHDLSGFALSVPMEYVQDPQVKLTFKPRHQNLWVNCNL